MGKQQPAAVGHIAVAVRNAGQGRDQRRLERILKQDGEIESCLAERSGQRPLTAPTCMRTGTAIPDDLVDRRMSFEQLADCRLGQEADPRVRKALTQCGQRGSHHDGISEPVRRPHQQPLDGAGAGQLFKTTRVHSSNPSTHSTSIRTAHILVFSENALSFTASFSVVTIRVAPSSSAWPASCCTSSTEYS